MLFLPDSRSLICDKRKRDNHTKPFFKTIQKGENVGWEKKYPLCSFMSTHTSLGKKVKILNISCCIKFVSVKTESPFL